MHPQNPAAPTIPHHTTTFTSQHHPTWPYAGLPAGPQWAHATCRCGWTDYAESRHNARVLARHHRRLADRTRVFHPGWASRTGPREHNADAIGMYVSITGHEQAWAVADGIGDDTLAARAARYAAITGTSVAARHGSAAGLLAATDIVRGLDGPDTVMVLATPWPDTDGGGWDIVWTGDCRAYDYDPATGLLRLLTADHTRGEQIRTTFAERYRTEPAELEELAAAHDHVVYSSVGTATASTLGQTTMIGPRRRLLLTSDGIHQAVPHRSIATIARIFTDPEVCARKLTLAARYFGGRDNTTALVIDPQPAVAGRQFP
jgi:serine/threonine protein phosphatase PrpC